MKNPGARCLLAAVAASLAACVTTPTMPHNAPAGIPFEQLDGDPGVAFSEIIAPKGEPVVASAPVSRDGVLVRSAYRYKHTAALTEDVTGFSFTVSGVQSPAGAPGYYAGRFESQDTYARGVFDLWCFLPQVVGGKRESLCLLRNRPGVAAIAPTRMNPWLWVQFSPATGSFDYVNTPIFERREVDIPGDLHIEYRFAGWNREGARVEIFAVGRAVETIDVSRRTDGKIVLRTIVGDFVLSAVPGESDRASIARL